MSQPLPHLVRAAGLSGFTSTSGALGIDGFAVLRQVGLSPAMIASPDAMLPAEAVIGALELAAARASCITFGLRMAERRSLADMGAVSLLLAHQPTLREAFGALARFRNRINPTLALRLEEGQEIAIVHQELVGPAGLELRQSADLALGVLARICASVLQDGWRPESVNFSYAAPPPAERQVYARLFGCPARFEAEFTGLVLPVAMLDQPGPHADAGLALHATSLLEMVMLPAPQSTAMEVEQAILGLLPTGRAALGPVARALGLSVRTLQRRLAAEGRDFTCLLNHARKQRLRSLCANPALRLTDIAGLLGYSSLAAFSRWHRANFDRAAQSRRRDIGLSPTDGEP
jgi:AraC-like DNA-binding protein